MKHITEAEREKLLATAAFGSAGNPKVWIVQQNPPRLVEWYRVQAVGTHRGYAL